ncbi:hypothetical protein T484DRAFT_1958847, partial [Baffinella frigidus]
MVLHALSTHASMVPPPPPSTSRENDSCMASAVNAGSMLSDSLGLFSFTHTSPPSSLPCPMKCTMRTSRLQASIMVRWKSSNVVW